MVQKKKKPDKLIAGFLALLTAFSPVASVVPVYASSTEDGYGNSVTMDPDSIQKKQNTVPAHWNVRKQCFLQIVCFLVL